MQPNMKSDFNLEARQQEKTSAAQYQKLNVFE